MDSNITQVAMTVYLSFSIIFFTVCIFYDYSIVMYLSLFLVFAFIMQFSVNLWASAKVCPLGEKQNVSIEKALGYTVLPWFFILVIISFILYIMPGWVRVFSNTLGLAVAKSIYYELFTVEDPAKAAGSTDTPKKTNDEPPGVRIEKKMGGAGEKNGAGPGDAPPAQVTPNPDVVQISPDVISEIYHDPSKIINEVEYLPEFDEWYDKIFIKYLKSLPYFNNPKFFNEADVYKSMAGGEGGAGEGAGAGAAGAGAAAGLPDTPGAEKKKKEPNPSSNIHKLYKCVAIKEKIGYFTWLFLSGAIFTLTSLTQMYSSDC